MPDLGDASVTNKVNTMESLGTGSINPDTRAEKGEIDMSIVESLVENIDSFYIRVPDGDEQTPVDMRIPRWCVDGRCDAEGYDPAPDAAGGTYSLVSADALIDCDALLANGENCLSHADQLFDGLIENGYEIGGHCDNHASGENSGCGACDKMPQIFERISKNVHELSAFASKLGVDIPEELADKIANNAQALVEGQYMVCGADMAQKIRDKTDDSHVETLQDAHNEVALVVNTQQGTTLDRRSLASELGTQYQAFNLDVWALENGVRAIASTEQEFQEKFAAAVLYNIATASVLTGPSMRLVVR